MPPDPPLDVTGIARRQFSTTRRGYDPAEVRAFLHEVADVVGRLQRSDAHQSERAERAEARAELAERLDQHRLVELLGEETARVLEAARAAAADIREKAEENAARLVREGQVEAHRLAEEAEVQAAARKAEILAEATTLRREAEAEVQRRRLEGRDIIDEMRRGAEAEVEALLAEGERGRAEAEIEADRIRELAREEGRVLVAEAQTVRERMLGDLARRRRSAREQLERLNAARERLLAAYEVIRRTVDEATAELTVALPEARAAAEEALRRATDEPPSTVEELEAELAVARMAGLVEDTGPEPASVGFAYGEHPAVIGGQAVVVGLSPDMDRGVEVPQAGDGASSPVDDTAGGHDGDGADAGARRGHDVAGRRAAGPRGSGSDTPWHRWRLRRRAGATRVASTTDRSTVDQDLTPAVTEPPAETTATDAVTDRPVGSEPADETAERGPAGVDAGSVAGDGADADIGWVADVGSEVGVGADADVGSEVGVGADADGARSVDDLFARLRSERPGVVPIVQEAPLGGPPAGPGGEPAPPVTEAPEPVGPIGLATPDQVAMPSGASDDAAAVQDDSSASEAETDGELDPGDALLRKRDQTLEPIERELGRRLKRVLADEQNEALDLLRRMKPSGLEEVVPSASEHSGRYADAAVQDLATAAAWGASAAGGEPGAPCDDLAAELGRTLVEPLRERMARSFDESDGDVEEVTERLRALYREWKGQHIGETVRHYAAAAFAWGAYTATPDRTELRWLVDHRSDPCPDADDNALADRVRKGETFPTGDCWAPAHPGCRCLVVPSGHLTG